MKLVKIIAVLGLASVAFAGVARASSCCEKKPAAECPKDKDGKDCADKKDCCPADKKCEKK